jgi:ribonuclease P protein component
VTKNKKSFLPHEKTFAFERLANDSEFELVYKKGIVVISEDEKIKAKYLFANKKKCMTAKIGLSIASKKGNSVWRNRVKRILRESIRNNRDVLRNILEQKNADLLIIFSPYSINQANSQRIFLGDIKPSVLDIFKKMGK